MLGFRNIALESWLSGQSRKNFHDQCEAVFLCLLSDLVVTMDLSSQRERFLERAIILPSLISKLIVISFPKMPQSLREKLLASI